VQVLSSPRISTVNNQKAVIKVGQDEFFVTDISNTTTTVTGSTTNNPEIELTPFFSGIALDVTPQIGENDEIILHIHPSISKVDDQVKTITLGDEVVELPLALSTIRESDSIVFAKSGQIVVLGGLMQDRAIDQSTGLPFFQSIPVFGYLFGQQRQAMVKSELVILLKPVIVGSSNTSGLLDDSQRRIKSFRETMQDDFFDY
jgi:MSHA biogenesis protein MshL